MEKPSPRVSCFFARGRAIFCVKDLAYILSSWVAGVEPLQAPIKRVSGFARTHPQPRSTSQREESTPLAAVW